jgi:hypothetical protein
VSIAVVGTHQERVDRKYPPEVTNLTFLESDTGKVFKWTGAQWLQEFYIVFGEDDRLKPICCGLGEGLRLENRFVRILAPDPNQAQVEAERIFCAHFEQVSEYQPADHVELIL